MTEGVNGLSIEIDDGNMENNKGSMTMMMTRTIMMMIMMMRMMMMRMAVKMMMTMITRYNNDD